jgi:lipoprotein-releasing system permease protein
MALIVVLSFFNGLDDLIKSLFNSFDPELKITVVEGKTFTTETEAFERIKNMDKVAYFTEVLEENALVRYGEKTEIATIKGVSEEFVNMTGIDSMIIDGSFELNHNDNNFAVIGRELAINLSVGLNFVTPLVIYMPERVGQQGLIPDYKQDYIFPSGVFSIQDQYDSRYIIVPIEFTRQLLDYSNEVSSVEIKLISKADIKTIQKDISNILGEAYEVNDHFQQHKTFFKLMKSEKWAVFLILTFILIVASFNIIGSLTMLILDKKEDIRILDSMGADSTTIRKIFLFEGWLISAIGAFSGIFLGILICLLQQWFGLVKFPESGSFIVSIYPVKFVFTDFLFVALTVLGIGFIAAWFPARKFGRLGIRNDFGKMAEPDNNI